MSAGGGLSCYSSSSSSSSVNITINYTIMIMTPTTARAVHDTNGSAGCSDVVRLTVSTANTPRVGYRAAGVFDRRLTLAILVQSCQRVFYRSCIQLPRFRIIQTLRWRYVYHIPIVFIIIIITITIIFFVMIDADCRSRPVEKSE